MSGDNIPAVALLLMVGLLAWLILSRVPELLHHVATAL